LNPPTQHGSFVVMNSAQVMTVQFKRSPISSVITCALIVALFVGGLPMLSGIVVAGDSQPAFTLDICHPVGGAAHSLTPLEAPLVPAHGIVQRPMLLGMAHESVIGLSSRLNEAPDPPPPKTGA
jgi:hypothetical protein